MTDMDGSWTAAVESRGYTVLGPVDHGSFSEVFKIEQHHTGKVFALKKIESNKHAQDDACILGEIECLANLRHRHVIQLKDFVIDKHIACIIMEYAPLGNLQQRIDRGDSLSKEETFTVFQQLLSATAYCHCKNIAHCDLNPSNVLLVSKDVVKLGDFGLAIVCSDADGRPQQCVEYLGQVAYLPPEVLMERPFDPKPADMWSLGCILFFICYETKPYLGSTKTVLAVQLGQGMVIPERSCPSTPALCVSTLLDMCRVQTDQRPSADSMVEHWDRWPRDSLG